LPILYLSTTEAQLYWNDLLQFQGLRSERIWAKNGPLDGK